VHAATTPAIGNIDLATHGLASIDDHGAFDDGDRVLVKDQVDATENGIYAAHTTAWTRTTDMDGTPSNEVQGGTTTYVQEGTVNGDSNWVVIWDGDVVVDTDPMNWSLVSAGSSQNLWETFQDDSAATITATGPTDTLIVAGGTAITTAVAGTTLTITNDSPNIVQDVFGIVTGDTGSAAASGDGTELKIVGDGVTTSTAVSDTPDKKVTISVIGGPLASRLQDSDNNTFIDLEITPDSNNINMETGVKTGAAGGSVDIVASFGDDNRDGGGFNVTAGDGGDSTTAAASGLGGSIAISSGAGGTGPFVFGSVGSDAGSIQITSGDGGTGTDAGNGGDITITSGEPGSFDDGGISGFGGDITLLPGGSGSGAGAVVIGQASHLWPNTDGGANTVLTTLATQILGNVTASSMVFKYVAPRDMVLFDFGHRMDSETLPPVDSDFDITLNGTTIGTIRFYASGGADLAAFDFGAAGGFPGTSGTAVQHAISAGDVVRIIAPATSTTGFDDVSITLRGGVEPNVPVGSLSANFSAPGLDPSSLTLNVTGEFTHIEYACVAVSTDSGTNWYPLDAHEHGFGTTVGVTMNSVNLLSESEYLTDTDTTPSISENTGSGLEYRIQATVYGPGGIVTTSVDAEFGGF
jgi:hypothetical protein